MLRLTGVLCTLLIAVGPVTEASAATFIFAAPLSGAQENPPNISPGTGNDDSDLRRRPQHIAGSGQLFRVAWQ